MVSDHLIDVARQEVGEQRTRFLITGGTGFIGSHIARVLDAAGYQVTVVGRNPYQFPLFTTNITFVATDIRDRAAVIDRCADHDVVIHAAALSRPWGNKADFHDVNVVGTQNVIDGCIEHSIKRLIHISSTAIFFDFSDKFDIKEGDPIASPFSCEYAKSKAIAEERIKAACQSGLNALTIRARAVFGPGDTSLLPRLIDAARQKRLRILGSGENRIDMTYVDNLVYAIILAINRGDPGEVCTITNQEPVKLWELLNTVLSELGLTPVTRRVPFWIARCVARAMECFSRITGSKTEPALTQYAAGLLSKNQTFDSAKSVKTLGYRPLVSMSDGLQLTIGHLKQQGTLPACKHVRVTAFTTGFTPQRECLVEANGSNKTLDIHATCFLIDHPDFGRTLFDTGYTPRFMTATKKWPYLLYRKITGVTAEPQWSVVQRLKRLGIEPAEVKRIVLSHFHGDHICGLLDFPNSEIIASGRAWDAVKHLSGIRAIVHAFLPQLIPSEVRGRMSTLVEFTGPGIGPFRESHDLFGDESVRLVKLDGHATGQIGMLLRTEDYGWLFFVADSVWTAATILKDLPLTRAFRITADSARAAKVTRRQLVRFHQQFPQVTIVPTHCPSVLERFGIRLGDESDSDVRTQPRERA